MNSDNIFPGLKVVDLSSFIAGPAAAVILSDYGADVIKVEPPTGDAWRNAYRIPPQPRSHENYPWQLNNRNKRGLALDLKSPQAPEILERLVKWADVLIVNTPHPARKKLKLEYEDVAQWNPRLIYADLTGYGEKGPDASLPGFDITAYWARSGLLSLTRDAGAPPTLPPAGSGDHATAVTLYSAIVTALYRRERTGKGSYVTTSLLAAGVWACAVFIQGALCDAEFFPLHDRLKPPNATLNVYRASDDTWFLIVILPDHWPALAKGIGRPDLLTDARFADPAKQMANAAELTGILDKLFATQPMSHWREVFDQAHLTYGVVHAPSEVGKEPIDLDLDLKNRVMYWTDRGDPPRGNTVNRAPMDAGPGARKEPEIVLDHLMEGIGLALDLKNNRMFMTDLGGSAYSCNLDGSNRKTILFAQGNLSGIAYAEIPA